MTRWAPAKRDVMEALAAEIAHNYGRGRVIVAVDAVEGDRVHSASFADDLAVAIEQAGHVAFRASTDDFRRPEAERLPGGEPLDLSLFMRVLVEPFRMAGSTGFVLDAYDAERDVATEPKWITAGPDAILIVDGSDLSRRELSGLWNYSVRLEGEEEADRTARAAAVAIIDLRDPDHPRRVFADSC
jgi:hypothetical protein